jgi:DNA-directed RNA polymerase subunit RPC12/RpoP
MPEQDDYQPFVCDACGAEVVVNDAMGTAHRNHCPVCLASKHVDDSVSGDRAAQCGGVMLPIGLKFKAVTTDRWGGQRYGELMLIHRCEQCGKISVNRIAADDDPKKIEAVFVESLTLPEADRTKLAGQGIHLIEEAERGEIKKQLYGKTRTS